MTAQRENSVLFALSELHQIEAQRVAEEVAREAERKRQAEEKAKREREEEQHRQRVAEAEARLRVAEQLRVGEIEGRAAQIEHELRVTRAERSLLQESLASAVESRPQAPASRGLPVYLGWTAVLLLCVGGTTAAMLWPTERTPVAAMVPVARPAPRTLPDPEPQYRQQLADLEARLNKIIAERPAEKPAARPHPAAGATRRPAGGTKTGATAAPDFDKCSDDPLGCVTIKSR